MITCPDCKGRGSSAFTAMVRHADGSGRREDRVQTCGLCRGAKVITAEVAERLRAGRAMAEDRKARLMSLRGEAKRLGITPQELNDREWGRSC